MLRKSSTDKTAVSFIESYNEDYKKHLLNQTGEQAKTTRAARHAIENADTDALNEVELRLLDGRNNRFSLSVYTSTVKEILESDHPARTFLDDIKDELLDNNDNSATVKHFITFAKYMVDTKTTQRRNRDEVNHTNEPR